MSTPILKLTMFLDITPFTITPLDFQVAWQMDDFKSNCMGLSHSRQMLDVDFGVSTEVYECRTGLFNYLYGGDDYDECKWVEY